MAKYEGHNAQVAVTSDHMIVVVSISQSTQTGNTPGVLEQDCSRIRASQPVSAEPVVDSFSHSSPSRLEHDVVTHVGEEFCFGVICARRCAYFFRGVRAVVLGP